MHSIARQKLSDFDEIWYITADLELYDSHVTKYEFFIARQHTDARY